MATKQTRRSISVRGATYETLRQYCQENNRSMSDIVEEQLAALLGGKAKPAPVAARPAAPRPRTVANKVVVRPEPRVAVSKAEGRPAPRPFTDVVPERVKAPKGDYRSIRF
jgi:hypothetical protein